MSYSHFCKLPQQQSPQTLSLSWTTANLHLLMAIPDYAALARQFPPSFRTTQATVLRIDARGAWREGTPRPLCGRASLIQLRVPHFLAGDKAVSAWSIHSSALRTPGKRLGAASQTSIKEPISIHLYTFFSSVPLPLEHNYAYENTLVYPDGTALIGAMRHHSLTPPKLKKSFGVIQTFGLLV